MRPSAPWRLRRTSNSSTQPAIRATAIALIGVLSLSAWGCGYRFATRGQGLGDLKTAAVVTLENRSNHPEIALIITESIRRELLSRGVLGLVPDPARADLVVEGRVPDFEIMTQTVSSISGALEYSASIALSLRVREQAGEPYTLSALHASVLYPASADIEVTRKNRVEAFRRIGDILAIRIWDSIELRYAP
jgi:hypothetical protein